MGTHNHSLVSIYEKWDFLKVKSILVKKFTYLQNLNRTKVQSDFILTAQIDSCCVSTAKTIPIMDWFVPKSDHLCSHQRLWIISLVCSLDCLTKPKGDSVLRHLFVAACHQEEPALLLGAQELHPFEEEPHCAHRAEYHLVRVVASEVLRDGMVNPSNR